MARAYWAQVVVVDLVLGLAVVLRAVAAWAGR